MRRIKYIAPVESMQGNLSGNQKLEYALNDNPAFEAPDGRQYARNYRASYIANRRARDGRAYFSVKTKSAVNNTDAARVTQAALGAAANMASRLFGLDKWATIRQTIVDSYENAKAKGRTKATSARNFFVEYAAPCFAAKQSQILVPIFVEDGTYTQYWGQVNPFVGEGQYDEEQDVWVDNFTLVKFWLQLAHSSNTNLTTPVYYYVAGQRGVGFLSSLGIGNSFSSLMAGGWNVLGLEAKTVGATANAVCMGEMFLSVPGVSTPVTSDMTLQATSTDGSIKYVLNPIA